MFGNKDKDIFAYANNVIIKIQIFIHKHRNAIACLDASHILTIFAYLSNIGSNYNISH